ncbi:MAG: methylenetetrahydrofolate reductase [NAD(P)H] [Verrucomicrobiae bacterium]|nr:methylenetetrahydrofolate reductase [NAD(P)H] [Verrucomicrobiae bacterium]
MRFIRDIFREAKEQGRPVISFEFFTPKTPEGERILEEKTIPDLKRANPDFCSVTYGAGGSTKGKTIDLVDRIQSVHKIVAMAHLTCVNATKQETVSIVNEAKRRGIINILALRGDPPGGVGEFKKIPDGFEFAYELVDLLKQIGDFSIGVAGFPEGHIACKEGKFTDWERLKFKVCRGADFIITQLFFDNSFYYEMVDYLIKHNVKVPIVPGIIPITSASQIKKFTALCGATIPETLQQALDKYGNDDNATTEFGIEYAAKQCDDLLKNGVPGLHFYTLNKSESVLRILKNIGLFNHA